MLREYVQRQAILTAGDSFLQRIHSKAAWILCRRVVNTFPLRRRQRILLQLKNFIFCSLSMRRKSATHLEPELPSRRCAISNSQKSIVSGTQSRRLLNTFDFSMLGIYDYKARHCSTDSQRIRKRTEQRPIKTIFILNSFSPTHSQPAARLRL